MTNIQVVIQAISYSNTAVRARQYSRVDG